MALEARASPGFFRSWTFLGCLAEQRLAGARLLAVTQDGDDVALALLGGTQRHAWLNETGAAAHDAVFIEHNGLLIAEEASAALPAALRAARGRGQLVLSGIDEPTLQAARQAGWVHVQQSRASPHVALDTLGGDYLGTLSANARSQIRRSMRLYGPGLALERAESVTAARDWLAEMMAVHQAAWQARGQPGAFAAPEMREFHAALVSRAWALGQADLLRVSAGHRHIGTLYTLLRDGTVYSYQSGFGPVRTPQEKPGLVCHALAVAHYAARGAQIYDLLAGADRYKLTLASGSRMLHWATLYAPGSLPGTARMVWRRVSALRGAA